MTFTRTMSPTIPVVTGSRNAHEREKAPMAVVELIRVTRKILTSVRPRIPLISASIILPPSSGMVGRRLDSESTTFMITRFVAVRRRTSVFELIMRMYATIAKQNPASGPANATAIFPAADNRSLQGAHLTTCPPIAWIVILMHGPLPNNRNMRA